MPILTGWSALMRAPCGTDAPRRPHTASGDRPTSRPLRRASGSPRQDLGRWPDDLRSWLPPPCGYQSEGLLIAADGELMSDDPAEEPALNKVVIAPRMPSMNVDPVMGTPWMVRCSPTLVLTG